MTERSDMDLPDGGKSYKLVAEGDKGLRTFSWR